ncbi:MAG: hypothetical protein Fur005_04520 [Roseiflexaceae bacterium]
MLVGALMMAQIPVASQSRNATAHTVALPLVVNPGTTEEPLPAANPYSIQITPDHSRATQAMIGAAGGRISVSDQQGISYTLDIPAAAIEYSEVITLTPALIIEQFPFTAGSQSMVLIEPAGLELQVTGQLTISGASAGTVGYAIDRLGENFHLRALLPSLNQSSTPVQHMRIDTLRGYGTTSPTPAEQLQQQARVPAAARDWLEQQVVLNNGQIQLGYIQTLQLIERLIQPARDNPLLIEQAATDYLFVDRLLSIAADQRTLDLFRDESRGRFYRMIELGVIAAHQRCLANRTPSEGIRIVRVLRILHEVLPDEDLSALQSHLSRCLTYTITFRSKLTEQGSGLLRRMEAEATIPVSVEDLSLRLQGSAPIGITRSEWLNGKPCETFDLSFNQSTFFVRDNPHGLWLKPSRTASAIELIYTPGLDLFATYTFRCPTPGGPAVIPFKVSWGAIYDLLHIGERATLGSLAYRTTATGISIDAFTGWVSANSFSSDGATFSEDTQIELNHTPQP